MTRADQLTSQHGTAADRGNPFLQLDHNQPMINIRISIEKKSQNMELRRFKLTINEHQQFPKKNMVIVKLQVENSQETSVCDVVDVALDDVVWAKVNSRLFLPAGVVAVDDAGVFLGVAVFDVTRPDNELRLRRHHVIVAFNDDLNAQLLVNSFFEFCMDERRSTTTGGCVLATTLIVTGKTV